jgi:hypothetical protein
MIWVSAPYRHLGRLKRFGETASIFRAEVCQSFEQTYSASSRLKSLQPWRGKEDVSPKRWHPPTSLHGAETQANVKLAAVKTSNFTDVNVYGCKQAEWVCQSDTACRRKYCLKSRALRPKWLSISVHTSDRNGAVPLHLQKLAWKSVTRGSDLEVRFKVVSCIEHGAIRNFRKVFSIPMHTPMSGHIYMPLN